MTIYLLHGWAHHGQQEEKWALVRAELAKSGFETKLLKIPGLSASLEEVWHLDDYVKWLEQTLPSEPVILLGHSFGGQLAIRFAALFPQRVSQLILIDAAGRRPQNFTSKIKRFVFFYLAKWGKRITSADNWRTWFYRLVREKDYYIAPPQLRKTMSNILADEIVADLPKLTQSTLIIWGAWDKVTPLSQGKLFASRIANAKLEIIETARHSPQFTHPQEVAQIITVFLKGQQ